MNIKEKVAEEINNLGLLNKPKEEVYVEINGKKAFSSILYIHDSEYKNNLVHFFNSIQSKEYIEGILDDYIVSPVMENDSVIHLTVVHKGILSYMMNILNSAEEVHDKLKSYDFISQDNLKELRVNDKKKEVEGNLIDLMTEKGIDFNDRKKQAEKYRKIVNIFETTIDISISMFTILEALHNMKRVEKSASIQLSEIDNMITEVVDLFPWIAGNPAIKFQLEEK